MNDPIRLGAPQPHPDRVRLGKQPAPLAARPADWADGPWTPADDASRRLSRQLVDERRQHALEIARLTEERDAARRCVTALGGDPVKDSE